MWETITTHDLWKFNQEIRNKAKVWFGVGTRTLAEGTKEPLSEPGHKPAFTHPRDRYEGAK